MGRHRRWGTRRIVLRLGVLTAFLGLAWSPSCGNLREDEYLCESAVARLNDCCGGPNWFNPGKVYCDYHPAGVNCAGKPVPAVYPELSVEESRCILATPCLEINQHGVCERAQEHIDGQPACP